MSQCTHKKGWTGDTCQGCGKTAATIIAQLEAELEKAKAYRHEGDFIDENGTTWTRPTGEAYRIVCKLNEKAEASSSRLSAELEKAKIKLSKAKPGKHNADGICIRHGANAVSSNELFAVTDCPACNVERMRRLLRECEGLRKAYEKERGAEIFEDGVEADAVDMSKAEVYAAGRDWVLDRWQAALSRQKPAPKPEANSMKCCPNCGHERGERGECLAANPEPEVATKLCQEKP